MRTVIFIGPEFPTEEEIAQLDTFLEFVVNPLNSIHMELYVAGNIGLLEKRIQNKTHKPVEQLSKGGTYYSSMDKQYKKAILGWFNIKSKRLAQNICAIMRSINGSVLLLYGNNKIGKRFKQLAMITGTEFIDLADKDLQERLVEANKKYVKPSMAESAGHSVDYKKSAIKLVFDTLYGDISQGPVYQPSVTITTSATTFGIAPQYTTDNSEE